MDEKKMGEMIGLHTLNAPFPRDGDEQALAESWAAGVLHSYVPTAGVLVSSIEDQGPVMWLFYELVHRGVEVTVRRADQGFWRLFTTYRGEEYPDRVESLVVRGPTLLLCMAQAMEWWGERLASPDGEEDTP